MFQQLFPRYFGLLPCLKFSAAYCTVPALLRESPPNKILEDGARYFWRGVISERSHYNSVRFPCLVWISLTSCWILTSTLWTNHFKQWHADRRSERIPQFWAFFYIEDDCLMMTVDVVFPLLIYIYYQIGPFPLYDVKASRRQWPTDNEFWSPSLCNRYQHVQHVLEPFAAYP